jgi:multidrug efflux pump subunit AcrB
VLHTVRATIAARLPAHFRPAASGATGTPPRLLDVGCWDGEGTVLYRDALGGAGAPAETHGIEVYPEPAAVAEGRGIRVTALDLERVATAVEAEIKRVPGTREVKTIGGPGRAVNVWIDPSRLRERGVPVQALYQAVQAANQALPAGTVVNPSPAAGEPPMLTVETGEFLQTEDDVGDIVVGVHQGKPIYLREVARIETGAQQAQRHVWHTPGAAEGGEHAGRSFPAVTLTVTKKPGENAVDVAAGARARLQELQNTVIPADVRVSITRDYGQTAAEKANKLIQKLAFATASVILLVGLALGKREAVIVGAAVILTLTATLFASWAWGFTLNRVSLFALIFSIGILVDDAIVVVENIHRHRQLTPDVPLLTIIPRAVDEVGGPTILATFTVIAALLPMAFVSGLMGPYMSPIPINASLGMAISLAIAFTVTPWLALKLTKTDGHAAHAPSKLTHALQSTFTRLLTPFLASAKKRLRFLPALKNDATKPLNWKPRSRKRLPPRTTTRLPSCWRVCSSWIWVKT